MKIDDALLDRLSTLAKLEFKGEERERIKADLQRMLDFVSHLDEVDTEQVEPLIHMTDETGHMRPDEIKGMVDQQTALKNAPSKDTYYFKVPKVISGS